MIRKGEITVVQASKRAGVTPPAIYQLVHRRRVASRKDGYRRFIDAASFEAYLAGDSKPSPDLEAAMKALRGAVTREWHAGRAAAAQACRSAL